MRHINARCGALTSNNKQMPLVNKYCHIIYQNEDLTDNVKQQLAMILRRVQLDLRQKMQKSLLLVTQTQMFWINRV
jgi:hypothetical protein